MASLRDISKGGNIILLHFVSLKRYTIKQHVYMSGNIAACFVVENRRNAFIYNIIARLKTRCAERLSIAEFRINYTVAGQGNCEVAGWIFYG